MIDRILSLLAPHSCCGCGNLGSILCDNCINDIISERFEQCLLCLSPTANDNLCKTCRATSVLDAAWCVGIRETSLKSLLDSYKFSSARQAGVIAARLLDQTVPILLDDVCVVPVPTASSHVRSRGFDHTHIIAKRFAKRRHLPCSQVLERNDSSTQHFKTREQRIQSASAGLGVRSKVPASVLLIDDIYTTGATMQACAQKLRESGVKTLYVAIIARQTLDIP